MRDRAAPTAAPSRIIVVNHGRVIADGAPAEIKSFTAKALEWF